ncbi:hypothetical protein P3T76_001655 [Phytophthora citrophthora]|uniref:Uncharacterized protein n=1 Tax=Phytophthora citrophthora TaxID=4793 RepID=A0AAD9LRX6_9STRA|nr:hypothetical protein P3T76_001655 [Phytophthora citrophthora]
MPETEPENEMEDDGEGGDDSYANAYLNDDVEESDDAELAEMLAKVQSIQQVEGRLQIETSAPAVGIEVKSSPMDASKASPRVSIPTSTEVRKSQSLVNSPSSSAGIYKSQDGITTISRSVLSARNVGTGTLLGVKKSAIYEDKLLQCVTTPKAIKKLQQKAVASPPGRKYLTLVFLRIRTLIFWCLCLATIGVCGE